MKLIRHFNLPFARKNVHCGPVPGGTFWAHTHANDLPSGPKAEAELSYMLRYGRVWVQDAMRPGTWRIVRSVSDLPRFRREFIDDYDGCRIVPMFYPFLPEFYFVPHSWRGKRMVERAERRAYARSRKEVV